MTWCMGVAEAIAGWKSCLGRVIFVLLRANSRRRVCDDSGSNFTPHLDTNSRATIRCTFNVYLLLLAISKRTVLHLISWHEKSDFDGKQLVFQAYHFILSFQLLFANCIRIAFQKLYYLFDSSCTRKKYPV